MKNKILIALLFTSTVNAQVIECPKFYPSNDTVINEVPYQHKGKGLVKKKELMDASAFGGEFNDKNELQGGRTDIKGGYDVELPLNTKWLVCLYGEDIQFWEELKLNPNIRNCTLQVRQSKKELNFAKLLCK